MANEIKIMPEFTADESIVPETGIEEMAESAIQPTGEEPVVEEKETPTEPPAVEKPAQQEEQKPQGVDTKALEEQVQKLQEERVKLLQDIQGLRGQKRELKKEDLFKVNSKLDELKDLHPDDVSVINRILKAGNYLTEAEVNQKIYQAAQTRVVDEFLNEFPEYKAENDLNDLNWNSLQRALKVYAVPEDPYVLRGLLRRAHDDLQVLKKSSGDRGIAIKQRQVQLAGAGSTNAQRSPSKQSSGTKISSRYRDELLRGGWTEEEVNDLEN